MDINKKSYHDRMSLGFSLLIAICVIGLFCLLSLAVARHVEGLTNESTILNFSLPILQQEPLNWPRL